MKKYVRKFKKSNKVPKKVKTYVKKTLDRMIEDKYFQGTGTFNIANSDAAVGTSAYLTAMVQGTDDNQRVGHKIRVKSVKLDFTVRTEGDPDNFTPLNPFNIGEIKYALTNFKQQTGSILCSTPADGAYIAAEENSIWAITAANVICVNQRNVQGYQNMKLIKSGSKQIQVGGGAVNNPNGYHKTLRKKFKQPLMVQFTGNTNTASSCLKNGLWFNIMGCHVAQAGVNLVCSYGYTVTYEDA